MLHASAEKRELLHKHLQLRVSLNGSYCSWLSCCLLAVRNYLAIGHRSLTFPAIKQAGSEFLQRCDTLTWHHNPGKTNDADPVSRPLALLSASAVAPAAQRNSGAPGWLEPFASEGKATAAATDGSSGDVVGHFAGASLETPTVRRLQLRLLWGRTTPRSDIAPGAILLDRVRAAYARDAYFDGHSITSGCVVSYGLCKHNSAEETFIVTADNELRKQCYRPRGAHFALGHMGMNVILDRLRPCFCWNHGDMKMEEHN